MRFLYIIFSHDHPDQVRRLTRAIRQLSPDSLVAIHHDPSRSAIDPSLFVDTPDVYCIPDPIKGEWGGFSLVEQHIHSLQWCDNNLNFDWLVSITGLSYPIMPLKTFEEAIAQSGYDAYCYHFDAYDPSHWPAGEAIKRYHFNYFSVPKFKYWHKIPSYFSKKLTSLRVWLNFSQPFFRFVPMPRGIRSKLGFRRLTSSYPGDFRIYGGRLGLTVNRKATQRILAFIKSNPWWADKQRRTLIPDESYFNSIIANDPHLRIANELKRYVKWPKLHASSAAVIESQEVDSALESGAPFGLKFDSRVDPVALDLIDARLGITPMATPRHDKESHRATP